MRKEMKNLEWFIVYLALIPEEVFSLKDGEAAFPLEESELNECIRYCVDNGVLVQETVNESNVLFRFTNNEIRSHYRKIADTTQDLNLLRKLLTLKSDGYQLVGSKLKKYRLAEKEKNEIVREFIQNIDFDSGPQLSNILQSVTNTLSQLIETSRISIWKYHREREVISCLDLFETGVGKHDNTDFIISKKDYPAYFEGIEKGEVIYAPHAQTHPYTSCFSETYLKPLNIFSMLDVPFFVEGKIGGVVCFEHQHKTKYWQAQEIDFTESMCYVISLAIQTAHYHDLSLELDRNYKNVSELQRKREIFMAVIENSNDFVSFADESFNLFYVNPAGREKLNIPTGKDINISELVNTDTLNNLKENMLGDVMEGKPLSSQFAVRKYQSNQQTIFDNQIIRISNPKTKEFECFVNIGRDVQHRIDMENKIKNQMEELKQTQQKLIESEKMASLGVLVAGVAHEINNPINYIYSSSVALKDSVADMLKIINICDTITDANVVEKINEVKAIKKQVQFQEQMNDLPMLSQNILMGIEQVSEIVEGLRSFSKSGSGNAELVSVSGVIDMALIILHSRYKQLAAIQKEYESAPNVLVYKSKLNQVFVNILSNAIDAIAEKHGQGGKGLIIIRTGIKYIDGLMYSETQVEDNGCGMTEEVRLKTFDPFYTTKPVGSGTGLGMFIVRGIIELHRGEIKISSELGKGTTVTILIPNLPA